MAAQSQSSASAQDHNNEKYPESESQIGVKQHGQAHNKDASIDFKEAADN